VDTLGAHGELSRWSGRSARPALTNPDPGRPPLFQGHRSSPTGRRPWLLTLLCLTGALLLLWTWQHALSGETARAFGPGYWPYFVATTGALAVALAGVWRMRRWALWAFPGALLLDDGVVGAMGELRPGVLVIQAAAVLLVLAHARAFGDSHPR
jgi:hypothetical protein